ncbi:MAG TPA: RDD family protein, partial [Candidatus Hydrogenedentes bacterium]|nr:RDD family protein [Candidatus Hydrogenedentota bacterium]
MPWYYAINNQRFGPYSDQEFSGIVAQGTIAPDTLVWKDGMQDWQPYRLVQGSVPVTPPASPTFNPGLATGGTAMVVCSSCSRTFPEDEVIQYQGAYICAACKPIFQQQLREGAVIGTNRVYGGFWIRLGARIIDGILIGGTFFILALVLGGITAATGGANGEVPGALGILLNLASVFVGVAYETFFIGKYGATLGKMACGLRVIT